MPDVPLNMGFGSAPGQTPDEGGPIFTNAYLEFSNDGGKSETIIRPVEGRKLFKKISDSGPCRALFEKDGEGYAVIGRNVAKFQEDGSSVVLGGLATDGHVTFSTNRSNQVTITGGGTSVVVEAGGLTQIDDADLPPAIDNAYVDGYTIYTIADGRFFASALDNSKDINALHFTTAEVSPDKNVRGIARGREFIAFGEESMQAFANDGGTEFPLSPIGGTAKTVGCGAAASALVLNAAQSDTLVWVDNNGIVKATPAYDGQRISTHAVERAIENDPDWRTMRASTYTRSGHVFYVLSGSNFTLVYDFATGKWHNRKTYGANRWNGSSIMRLRDKFIVGDAVNGSLYELDPDTYTDAGDHLVMTVQPPVVHQFPNRLRINSIEIDPLPGRGINSTDEHNADPKLMIEVSKDGGNTWHQQRTIETGRIGERGIRTKERRFGVTKNGDGFIPRFSVSAAVCRGFIANGSVNVDLLAP
ncbi:MAG: hypothetical protein AAF497_10335 [Planctomycetota bacterium]